MKLHSTIPCFLLALLLASCLPGRLRQDLRQTEKDFQDHVGFYAIDAESGKELFSYQSDRYFTPASNTKILTLYASLQVLGDSVPSLYYINDGDSLIFFGSGDPSLLNKNLPQSEVYRWLVNSNRELYFSDANFNESHFGPGWAWDDYPYQFSAERMPLPLYGNVLRFVKSDSPYPQVLPRVFQSDFYMLDSGSVQVSRDYARNEFYYRPADTQLTREVAYRYHPLLTSDMLTDTLQRKVHYTDTQLPETYNVLYHPHPDSIYMEMMKHSDNMIAEHLMLMIGGVATDRLSVAEGIAYIEQNYLKNMPDKPKWVDGSGLSRYNLLTPRSIVWLWQQLYRIRPQDELFALLAQGGQSGTLQNYYTSGDTYLFGKTGTLSNVHNLSGFLRTAKGRLVIFSFMNNHYPGSSAPVKKRIETIINEIYQKY